MGAQANYVQGVKEKLQAGMGSEGVWWYLIQEKKRVYIKNKKWQGERENAKYREGREKEWAKIMGPEE